MLLKYNSKQVDKFTVEDWKDLYQTMVDFSNRVYERYKARIEADMQTLCAEIENLPASEQQTKISVLAADIRCKLSDNETA